MLMRNLVSLLCLGQACAFMSPSSLLQGGSMRQQQARRMPAKMLAMPSQEMISQVGDLLLAYTDDSKQTLNSEIIGVSFIGAFAGLAVVFALLTKNLQGKSFAFSLSEEEQAAVDAIESLFDPLEEDRVIVEAGSVGFVKRREIADAAKERYQAGKSEREVRDKTLYYAEVDLGFLATLLRAAKPQGGVFYDLGSGVGRAAFGAGKLGGFRKIVGIEYLGGLHKEALKYEGKYKRLGGAPTQFINKDFTDPSIKLNDADVIFAYATKYFATNDGKYAIDVTEKVLASAPVGARIIVLDKQLKGSQFKLIKTIDDPRGDLQLVKGYVYELVA